MKSKKSTVQPNGHKAPDSENSVEEIRAGQIAYFLRESLKVNFSVSLSRAYLLPLSHPRNPLEAVACRSCHGSIAAQSGAGSDVCERLASSVLSLVYLALRRR